MSTVGGNFFIWQKVRFLWAVIIQGCLVHRQIMVAMGPAITIHIVDKKYLFISDIFIFCR